MLAFLCCCCPFPPCKKCYRGCPCGDGRCCEFKDDSGSDYKEKSIRALSGADLKEVQQVRHIDSPTTGDRSEFTADPSVITVPPTLYTRQRELAEKELKKEKNRRNQQKNQTKTAPEIVLETKQSRSSSLSETTSVSNSTSIFDPALDRETMNKTPVLLPGYSNAAFDPESTIVGNRVEIDSESYATTAELRDLKTKKWVNPGSMASARIDAKLPSEFTYTRTREDSFSEMPTEW